MWRLALFFACGGFLWAVRAQSPEATPARLNALLHPVETARGIRHQKLEVEPEGYWIFRVSESGGDTSEYRFDPAWIDPYAIEVRPKEDHAEIRLPARYGLPVIRKVTGGTDTTYVSDFVSYARGRDSGRALARRWSRVAAHAAGRHPRESNLSGLYDRLDWLAAHIHDVGAVSQEWENLPPHPGRVEILRMRADRPPESFTFNLSAFLPLRPRLIRKKGKVVLQMLVPGEENWVRSEKEGEFAYLSGVEIYFDTPEEAADFVPVWATAARAARDRLERSLPRPDDPAAIWTRLNEAAIERRSSPSLFFEGQCHVRITVNRPEYVESFTLPAAYADTSSLDMTAGEKGPGVIVQIRKDRPWIRHEKDGKFKSFRSVMRIPVADYEQAFFTRRLLARAAALCRRREAAFRPRTAGEALRILQSRIYPFKREGHAYLHLLE
ncbi:MAG: hypothetical protein GXO27_03740, partial [Chlorobi bacterium]|nr:hypothetical protein [Chlorobiota bacterium]